MSSLMLVPSMLINNLTQKQKKAKKVKLKKSQELQRSTKLEFEVCRICTTEKGDIPIFNNNLQPNIPEAIEQFGGITVSNTDNLSSQMCQNCFDLLNGCIMFRELCQRSQKVLVVSIKEEDANYDNNDAIKLSTSYEKLSYKKHINEKYDHETISDEIVGKHSDEDFYNIPSPSFSEDCEQSSGQNCCVMEFNDLKPYEKNRKTCKTRGNEPKGAGDRKLKSFLCDICGKTARSRASLIVHMGIHQNIFPFKCDQCPYKGRTMDLLKVHKRSHLADKPFKCSQCPKATTTSSNLAKHMRHVHSTTRPHKCAYCDKAFSYQHDMKRHIKDIHLRQGTVECDVCYKKFNTKKILQGHRWKIHKIKGDRQGRLPSYLRCQKPPNQASRLNEDNCGLNY